MPTKQLKSMARKRGLPAAKAEEFWAKAKRQYGTKYAAVMGTVRKMLDNAARGKRKK
jgi:hypothetical protein